MTEEEIRKCAFAMPLTSPAFPPGHTDCQRECIITYRTIQNGARIVPGACTRLRW
jgi:acetoacetate decarboxylase